MEDTKQGEEFDTQLEVELWNTIRHIQMSRGKTKECAEYTASLLVYGIKRGLFTGKSIIAGALRYAQKLERDK